MTEINKSPASYRRQWIASAGDLRLDANEGPAPCLGYGATALARDSMQRYPDASHLEADLAGRWGVDPACVLVTAGIDDAIDSLCRRRVSGGREIVLPTPTFEMFARHVAAAGGQVVGVPWDDAFPVDAVAGAVTEKTGAVAVVSPNNPTGAVASVGDLKRLRAATSGVPLVLDLAYVEFADEDPTAWALDTPGVIVMRTFSKGWGLAGARVGFVMGDRELIDDLRVGRQPYGVAGPSLDLARNALEHGGGRLAVTVARVREERENLMSLLKYLGAEPLDSQANFVLARMADAEFAGDALASLGVLVRTWPGDPVLGEFMRITCPGEENAYARLVSALRTVFEPEVLLLDMDGVIADEGPSYREAVLATLASYDVPMQRSELAAAKAAGGSNDDLILTRDLLSRSGRTPTPAEVARRFDRFYLGDEGSPGLCERETLIPRRDVLERLAARMPLAIVTGRPLAEADAFLQREGLGGLFRTLVGAEDAPGKPDPAPVRLALERLGLSRAWMVGDTPADIGAALAAGVVPLGVRTPDPADAPGDDALLRAGAVRVFDSLNDLEEVLP